MTVVITNIQDEPFLMEHWRILVLEGDREVYHDSASTKKDAVRRTATFLGTIWKEV